MSTTKNTATSPADTPEDVYPRPYANAQLNSRINRPLPDVQWEVRWRVALDPFFPYTFVLQAGNRIMLQGKGRWQLFNLMGESLALQALGDGDMLLRGKDTLAYYADEFGRITTTRLSDGSSGANIPVRGTEDYRRSFMAIHNGRLILVSSKQSSNPHNPVPVTMSFVDCYDISSFSAQTTGAFVPNLIQGLHFEVERVCAALAKDTIVLLLKNRVIATDLNLSVKVDKQVDIDPLAMSVDEEGAIYALVRKGNEEYALTMLTADGEIRTAVRVPAIGPGRAIPPIIGIDHAIYVLTQDSILALDRTGRRKWEQATGGEMAGGVFTSDNRLLVSTGSYIMSFSVEGTRGLVCAFSGETTTSPPVLVPQGGLVVTTQQALYYLFPKQR